MLIVMVIIIRVYYKGVNNKNSKIVIIEELVTIAIVTVIMMA